MDPQNHLTYITPHDTELLKDPEVNGNIGLKLLNTSTDK
jgi:hypothetical protein